MLADHIGVFDTAAHRATAARPLRLEPRPVPRDRLLLNTAMIICLLLGPVLVLTGQVPS